MFLILAENDTEDDDCDYDSSVSPLFKDRNDVIVN
jgi:hypothetical protein